MQYLNPQFLIQGLGFIGILAIIFAESGLFFGFFFPGDSLIFTAGLLAAHGYISIVALATLGSICAILGDNVGYAFGKKIGPKLFTKEDSIFLSKKYIAKSEKFFEKYGRKSILLARFVPVVRTFVPILAGVGNMEYKTFLSYNFIGGVLWVCGMAYGGYFFGKLIPNPDKYVLPVVIVIIILSLIPSAIEIIKARKS